MTNDAVISLRDLAKRAAGEQSDTCFNRVIQVVIVICALGVNFGSCILNVAMYQTILE